MAKKHSAVRLFNHCFCCTYSCLLCMWGEPLTHPAAIRVRDVCTRVYSVMSPIFNFSTDQGEGAANTKRNGRKERGDVKKIRHRRSTVVCGGTRQIDSKWVVTKWPKSLNYAYTESFNPKSQSLPFHSAFFSFPLFTDSRDEELFHWRLSIPNLLFAVHPPKNALTSMAGSYRCWDAGVISEIL